MREMLFRGRCAGEDYVYEWVDGCYVYLIDSYKKRETHRIYTGYAESDCGDFYGDWYEVDPKTVGQFTGLFDRNGERIFEGDVMNNAGNVVEFCNGSFCVNGDSDLALWTKTEVIGNIHDNPELMR